MFESAQIASEELQEGSVVNGKVVKITRDHVIVDIGYKSEGIIPIAEFSEPGGEIRVKPGDTVEVFIDQRENEDGLILLSKEKADRLKVWDEISEASERNEPIMGTITGRVKGGLAVTIRGGIKAFLPGSQVDIRPSRNLDRYMNQTYPFQVIKFNKKRGNVVLSRRSLLEQERDSLKTKTLEHLQEGMVVTGVIKNITEYGAFVDLGGIDGLLHVTDMSWGRVGNPAEAFQVGTEVTCKVLKYDPEKERVSLGLKQTMEDPWQQVELKYPAQSRVKGKVVSLADYGAFIELEQGVEGLVHVSELAWGKTKHPSKVLNIGQDVEALVLEVDAKNKRISLGLKQLEADPWTTFSQEHSAGDIIRGTVRSITEYGIFVGINDAVDGMVHKSDLSWSDRIQNPSDIYRKGDQVEAIILSINHDERRVSLGIKQLYEDPWSRIPQEYPIGTVVEVRLLAPSHTGIFVELERGVEGYVPREEIAQNPVDDLNAVDFGKIVKALVISIDPSERRIVLSVKAAADVNDDEHILRYDAQKARAATPAVNPAASIGSGVPSSQQGASNQGRSGGATLGDVLRDKLGDKFADLTKNS